MSEITVTAVVPVEKKAKSRVLRPLRDFKRESKLDEPQMRQRTITTKMVKVIERRHQVITMRTAGHNIEAIAAAVGCSNGTVREDLIFVLRAAINETAESTEEHRALQLERLDGLLAAYYDVATEVLVTEDGVICPQSLAAAQLVLQIEARRAKLIALDMPENKSQATSAIREYRGVDLDKV